MVWSRDLFIIIFWGGAILINRAEHLASSVSLNPFSSETFISRSTVLTIWARLAVEVRLDKERIDQLVLNE